MKKHILMLLLMGLCCLNGCSNETSADVPALLEPAEVTMDTAVAAYGDMYRILAYSGEVVPYVEEVSFQTEGVLESLKVTVGDKVKKDQVLATLEGETIEKKIEALNEQIADETALGEFADRKALIDIEIAKIELEAMRAGTDTEEACLAKEISIERMQTELMQTQQLRQLELEKKNALLEEYRGRLSENVIRAPFDGTVVYVKEMYEEDAVNSFVPVVCVADENSLCIQTDYISQSNIEGADKLTARIGDKDYDISYVPMDESEYISSKLSGARLRSDFTVEQADDAIVSGQYAMVMLYYSSLENVLTIPVNALYQDGTGQYVYVIEDGERVRCKVKTGVVNDVEAQILEGLKEGDVVYVKE